MNRLFSNMKYERMRTSPCRYSSVADSGVVDAVNPLNTELSNSHRLNAGTTRF